MSDKPETLADICARIRKIDESMMRDLDFMAVFLEFLPRDIEAAAKRERDEDRQLASIAESDEAFARCARCDRPERAPGNAAATRKFDEAAFDEAVSKPNGWSDVDDPVAEIRRMRDGDAPGNAVALREALEQCGRALEKAQCSSAFQAANTGASYITAALSSAHAALAAPARNCDVGTAADALAAYTKDRDLTLSPEAQDAIWWLFEKAEKEETK